MTKFSSIFGVAAVFAGASSVALAAPSVTFVPGTYDLAESEFGPIADTLTVTVSGGVASFALDGDETASFSAQNISSPAGLVVFNEANPFFLSASLPSLSWDAVAYPYLSFFSTPDGGGLSIGDEPDGSGNTFVNLFQTSEGTGQVYTISGVPEPTAWATMLLGFALAGATVRRRRRTVMTLLSGPQNG